MSVLGKINLFLSIYIAQFLNIFRISAWLPFLALAAFQMAGLLLITNFNFFGFKIIVFPVLNIFLPESVFHYPTYYLAAPQAYALFENYLLGPTIWIITIAAATYKLGGLNRGISYALKEGYKKALGVWGWLAFLWLIEMMLVGIVLTAPVRFVAPFAYQSPRFAIFLKTVLQMAGFVVLALFVYAIPSMIIGQKRFGAAIVQSLGLCFHNFFFTFFIIFIPGMVRIGLDLLTSNFAPTIINQQNPEIILWAMFLNIGLGIFLNLFTFGAAAYAYQELSS